MLSDAFLSRLDTLMLAMKGRASGGAGGTRRSRQTGSSAEFSDYREYIPGDDIRRIDSNAMARFDRIFLKLFMEEQESAVTVLLDGSGSMAGKWDAARNAAEAVSYLALTGGDRLRVICLREDGNRTSPQLSGRQAYARLEQFLDTCTPQGGGTLTDKVMRIDGLRKGLCFLISDCYAEKEELGEILDYLRYSRQETGVMQVLSAFEMNPFLDGAVRLTDSETGGTVDLLADRGVLLDYQETLEQFLKETRAACFHREVPYLLLKGGESFEETMIPLLVQSGII
jgi:uncharacterized protein (DUF58 family)